MSSRGPPAMKRGPPVRNGGPPAKRSAPSGPMSRSKCACVVFKKMSLSNKVFHLSSFHAITQMACGHLIIFVNTLCVAAPMSRDRDPYGPPPPRRDSMMSRRDDYPSPRDEHYNSKDRWDIRLQWCVETKIFSLLVSDISKRFNYTWTKKRAVVK